MVRRDSRLGYRYQRGRGISDIASSVSAYFRALDIMDEAVTREGLTMPEVALRWLSHHSNLKPEHDGTRDSLNQFQRACSGD